MIHKRKQNPNLSDKVLETLQMSNGPVSGEQIAHRNKVSRAAVWKSIESLRERGIPIEAKPKSGYVLARGCDYLTESGIFDRLPSRYKEHIALILKQSTMSTNDDAKEWARNGAAEFSIVAAEGQTAGKGRRGRTFMSPLGTGVYLSIVIRPSMAIPDTTFLTAMAGVAVCRALGSFDGMEPSIKWVNDVYLGTRKVCGILTEGEVDFESGSLTYAVTGIGVNVYDPCKVVDAECRNTIGHMFDSIIAGTRNTVAAEIISNFIDLYQTKGEADFIEEYRNLSNLVDRRVIIYGDSKEDAVVARVNGITDELGLAVTYNSGRADVLYSSVATIQPLWHEH